MNDLNDLPRHVHTNLDASFSRYSSGFDIHADAHMILFILIGGCTAAYADIWPIDLNMSNPDACGRILDTREDIRDILRTAHSTGKYAEIRKLPEFHVKKPQLMYSYFEAGQREARFDVLREAYNKPFRGQLALDFLGYLSKIDQDVRNDDKILYAKALSIVQSSGTGKSRMLTEIGKLIFTLPICVRDPRSPGFPPSDKEVHRYFAHLHNDNDLSLSACASIACFLGAACQIMLQWLRSAQTGRSVEELHDYWYTLMELSEERSKRDSFFEEVIGRATEMRHKLEIPFLSPRRSTNGLPDKTNFKIETCARQFYNTHAKQPTEDLVAFVSSLTTEKPLVVMYFDEAHELRLSFWILLRLLTNQDQLTRMWYIFMGTKSSISFYNPAPGDMLSLRLREELACLLDPYIALGFDQNVICNNGALVTVTMGDLQSIASLSTYGRPMWNAQFRKGEDDQLIALAALKLTNGSSFDPKDKNHVLAVLSHRLCIEPIMASTEALQLADRSVANHMRLLTGFSNNRRTFYTYSPSEPLLTLGAIHLIYKDRNLLGQVLDTFSKNLCSGSLVEKGLLGELGGRTLLLVARDSAAPMRASGSGRDLLKPVLLIDFLDTLFGNKTWCHPHRAEFMSAFNDTYVNFTHWVVTKDSLPVVPSQQLLANLWSRGGALQCCFNQESLDLMFVTYKGSVAVNEIFDVANLSAGIVQIKYKANADTQAEPALRPIGIPRNIHRPLPYFAFLMELGNESHYQQTRTRIKATPSPPLADGKFKQLQNEWMDAVQRFDAYILQKGITKQRKKGQDAKAKALLKEVKGAQLAMDAYNRFTISVRGASPDVYGVLREANIVQEFATLLSVTMPSPTAQDMAIQHMRPLERLGETSAHTAWMSVYGAGEGLTDESMDVDT